MSIFLFLFLVGCSHSLRSSPRKKIYLGALFPSYTYDLYGFRASIEFAAETINNNSEILKDYEIVVKYGDTFGDPQSTVRRLFEFFQHHDKEPLRMIIGPAWSRNAVVSAIMCGSFGVYQIAYGATSIEFHLDDTKYKLLYTNVPSVSSSNKARLAIIKHFGWKKIAILRQYDDKLQTSTVQNFRKQIKEQNLNLTLLTIEGFSFNIPSHPRIQLEKLQKLDARIIIGEFSSDAAPSVFCEAYKMGMFGSKYVWLLAATVNTHWVFINDPETFSYYYPYMKDCNLSMVAQAADGFIVANKIQIRQDNNKTISGLTAQDFKTEIQKRNFIAVDSSSYAFDAMWTAGIVLNKSLSELPQYHPENIELDFPDAEYIYRKLLAETKFEGLTGSHRFFRRERQGIVQLNQMRVINGLATLTQFGSHDTFEDKLILNQNEVVKLWKDGKVPVDEAATEIQILKYSLVHVIPISVFSVLGILYSLGFLYFNITRRHHKLVRLSSPLINNVVLLGCIFCFIFVLLLGIDPRFVNDDVLGTLCNVRLYVLAIAFSLAFGALFSKTWRVHKIFTAQRAIKKKMMRDIHLLLFVFLLVIVDVIFITVWVYFDPLKPGDITFEKKKETSADLIIVPILKICECTHRTKLLGALYAYKGILLLFGVFLAWETRNVTIPALNDSKYIGISVYNVVILSAIGVAVSMTLKKTVYYELLYVLVSIVVILSTTFTLTIMFLPKLYEYFFTEPEPKQRVRTFDNLRASTVDTSVTEISDVYEAVVKKDVKHKWIQTDHFDQELSYQGHEEFLDVVSDYRFCEDSGEQEERTHETGIEKENQESLCDLENIELRESSAGVLMQSEVTIHKEQLGPVVNNGLSMDNVDMQEILEHGNIVDT